ncbi:uncharacterized protein METZ01_LOCUS510236, partial [marine metagenome]
CLYSSEMRSTTSSRRGYRGSTVPFTSSPRSTSGSRWWTTAISATWPAWRRDCRGGSSWCPGRLRRSPAAPQARSTPSPPS